MTRANLYATRNYPERWSDAEKIYWLAKNHIHWYNHQLPSHLRDWVRWAGGYRGEELRSFASYLTKENAANYSVELWPSESYPWEVTARGPGINLIKCAGKDAWLPLKTLVQSLEAKRMANLYSYIDYLLNRYKNSFSFEKEMAELLRRFQKKEITDHRIISSLMSFRKPQKPDWYYLNVELWRAWRVALAAGRKEADKCFIKRADNLHKEIVEGFHHINVKRGTRFDFRYTALVRQLQVMGMDHNTAMYSYRSRMELGLFERLMLDPKRTIKFLRFQ